MPRISEMIAATIEAWTERWKERMRGFVISIIKLGFTGFLEAFHESIKPMVTPFVKDLDAQGGIPDDLRAIFDDLTDGKQSPAAVLGMSIATGAGTGLTGAMFEPLFKQLNQQMYLRIRSSIPAPPELVMAYYRGIIDRDYLKTKLEKSGYGDEWIEKIDQLYQTLLSESALRQLFLRGEITEEKVRAELKLQGWNDERITEAMKLWQIIPPLADMVRFADYSAFDPEVIAKWRQFYDAPNWIADPMKLIGITGEWANKYWFSHWMQPGRFELGEMHRRGLIDDDATKLAYKTMGYSDYWQDLLLDLVKNVPTRVDVRRFWDMGTIDENRLREIYHAQGYYGKDLDDYVLWTKVYVAFPDLIARYKNGWITLDEALDELKRLGMSEDRAVQLIQTKIKPMQNERLEAELNLTKAEIVKGVKKGVITYAEGIGLLQDLGKSEWEADFILKINVEALGGSPESYSEFKDIVSKYKKALGFTTQAPSSEIIRVERELRAAKDALSNIRKTTSKPDVLTPYFRRVSELEQRYYALLTEQQSQS